MANRIKGITVEIGGDTTKLQTALKGVNSQTKNTQSALKDVEKLESQASKTNQTLTKIGEAGSKVESFGKYNT